MESERQHLATGAEATLEVADTSTMEAIVQDGYGSADVLRLAHIGRP